MLTVSESAADAFDLFEQPVVALGAGVGDASGQEGVDLGPPGVHGAGQGEQFGDLRVDAFSGLAPVAGGY